MNKFSIEVFMKEKWCKENCYDQYSSVIWQESLNVYPNKEGLTIILETKDSETAKEVYEKYLKDFNNIDSITIIMNRGFIEIDPWFESDAQPLHISVIDKRIVIDYKFLPFEK